MLRDVDDGRALEPRGRVVPPDAAPGTVIPGVEGVAAVERQVDPTHEGDAVVDHDRLLVMAVREAGTRSRGRS